MAPGRRLDAIEQLNMAEVKAIVSTYRDDTAPGQLFKWQIINMSYQFHVNAA